MVLELLIPLATDRPSHWTGRAPGSVVGCRSCNFTTLCTVCVCGDYDVAMWVCQEHDVITGQTRLRPADGLHGIEESIS